MEKEVKKNNKRLSNFFSLDIGNLLSRDYNVVGKSCYIYTSTSFDFDRYEISNSPSLETRRVENSEKLIYVSEGDIVVSLISQRATVVRIKEKMFLSPNYIKVTPKSLEIPKEYFVYWFNESYEARKQIEQGMQGSIINKLSINFLRELNFTRIENMTQVALLYALTLKKRNLLDILLEKQMQLVKGIYQNEKYCDL